MLVRERSHGVVMVRCEGVNGVILNGLECSGWLLQDAECSVRKKVTGSMSVRKARERK